MVKLDTHSRRSPIHRHAARESERVTRVDTQFFRENVGPQNIPDHINNQRTALYFLELVHDSDFRGLLCRQTNLLAEQVKQSKPLSYYSKNLKPVAVPELKAFLSLRFQIEKCMIKPRYETYWQGARHNFILHTPGYREVMERHRFNALWGFLHLVNQTDMGRVKDHWPSSYQQVCCPLSCGELAGRQQEPHAVHGPFLQLCHALPPAEERTGSPGLWHPHAKPQALHQGTQHEAEGMCPVRIPVLRRSVCLCLEGPQAHPLNEQLSQPSIHSKQACVGQAATVDRTTACD